MIDRSTLMDIKFPAMGQKRELGGGRCSIFKSSNMQALASYFFKSNFNKFCYFFHIDVNN